MWAKLPPAVPHVPRRADPMSTLSQRDVLRRDRQALNVLPLGQLAL